MGNHWYDKSGNSQYEIKRSDGKGIRPTTLRDAKKFGWLYSTTTVIGCAAKAGLDRWKHQQLLDTVKFYQSLIEDEGWQKKILEHNNKKLEQVMVKGTRIHDSLERIYKTGIIDYSDETQVFVEPVIEVMDKAFPGIEWISESSFAHKFGYGGKVDLVSKCGKYIVDFKTKDSANLDSLTYYDDYPMQLAAYRLGLNYPNAKCFNVFISNSKAGVTQIYQQPEDELNRGIKMFLHLLEYCKLLNKYDPSW